MTVSELRQTFLDYFASKGHTIVPSSPLVPANDPTLLFTNAGMVQFKDTFLGLEPRNYTRATSCQRCVRAGGKHNDLENVGYTARHHTFFEMLGNFSFGDYFKREAIQFAWEFLTEVIKLPPEKLWITVYEQDDEAADIWLTEIKIDPSRFSRCGKADNFWSMGDTGPCGPCSEIFYDHGSEIVGGPPGTPEADGDRYIEIWNLVFMQYNRDAKGEITPLPKPSVDTGMGLERLAAIMQNVHNNYDIDLFQNIIKDIAILANCNDLTNNSLRVIADHIRACSFLIIDGIVPSNEGRGYVLRRIIRRAIRHGHKLELKQLYRLVNCLEQQMGQAYPELSQHQELVIRILKQEEERFDDTLDRGMNLLEQEITNLTDKIIPGQLIFKLYDTYGFPTDLTADIARERDLKIDMNGFEAEMAQQRSRSSTASQFDLDMSKTTQNTDLESEFIGYECINNTG
ncbi:MAG: alanine--tRNA ligase, partial [Proteobacteria bacterium]|nr:alanine--tRNA ligase [Pseudomonadota bacterium]